MAGGFERLRSWLALLRAPGIGPIRFEEIRRRIGDPHCLFEADATQWTAWGIDSRLQSYLRAPDWEGVERDLRWAEAPGAAIVPIDDPRYPPLLARIADPPPLLFLRGDPDLLHTPQLAMVGSRNPTPGGRSTAESFARFLSNAGLTITSGLAMGIDAAAHRGALAGSGRTVAVTATGLDRVYPPSHRELAHELAERGLLLSEFPVGTPPRAGHFPRRNRIISGLSVGTLVVEAAQKSGSLITARLAVEQGREVFAIPGSIHNPLSRGCHALIREGAKLVETAEDILAELSALLGGLAEGLMGEGRMAGGGSTGTETAAFSVGREPDGDYRRLMDALGYDPEPVDLLIRRSGLTADAVSSMLLLLELEGHVSSLPGGRYCRAGKSQQETE